MRSSRRSTAGLTCLFALAIAGCSANSDGTSEAAPEAPAVPAVPGTSYAPYISATTASGTDSAGSPTTYNLAFVLSTGGECTPEWNGTHAIADATVKSRISRLKTDGATVRVSFGGASGKELAATCHSATELAEAYGDALDAAGSAQADFDIEGDELADAGSIALRSEAIALLQMERPGLEVSFTLPVTPSGLGDDGLALLESANDHGVRVAAVNLMTMNYGESYTGDMGDYAVQSAKAAHTQLKTVFAQSDTAAWQGMALTSMIGLNDVDGETFTLSDAAQVRSFAEENGIAWLSMWSATRDRQCADEDAAQEGASADCSGVKQSSGAFAKAFS